MLADPRATAAVQRALGGDAGGLRRSATHGASSLGSAAAALAHLAPPLRPRHGPDQRGSSTPIPSVALGADAASCCSGARDTPAALAALNTFLHRLRLDVVRAGARRRVVARSRRACSAATRWTRFCARRSAGGAAGAGQRACGSRPGGADRRHHRRVVRRAARASACWSSMRCRISRFRCCGARCCSRCIVSLVLFWLLGLLQRGVAERFR